MVESAVCNFFEITEIHKISILNIKNYSHPIVRSA